MADLENDPGPGDAPELTEEDPWAGLGGELAFLRDRVSDLKQENHELRCSVAKHNLGSTPEPEMPLEPERPTLRDRFAMAALQGLLAGGEWIDCSERAYKYADAILGVREIPPEEL